MIKYWQQDELTYIASHEQWQGDPDLHGAIYHGLDLLIDCHGFTYHLGELLPQATGQQIALRAAIDLTQAHFSSLGTCCAAKIFAQDIGQLIEFVGLSDKP